ncbi:hypothetical protein CEXT_138541 [Caerostris extrusa]|uniref:Uncharacterized protein n=1 Tax=Caerostris extrusa TaxID=172846 RepID=A0AAV4VP04_CAEEX|nr:hypothetical protein CEXT_138541 [Caerostris extrusa]
MKTSDCKNSKNSAIFPNEHGPTYDVTHTTYTFPLHRRRRYKNKSRGFINNSILLSALNSAGRCLCSVAIRRNTIFFPRHRLRFEE